MRFLFFCLMSLFMTFANQSAFAMQIAYVANFFENTVSVVDVASGEIIDTIPVPFPNGQVAFSPDGLTAYVTATSGTVTVIDVLSGTVTDTLTTPSGANALDFSPDGSLVYVASQTSGEITPIDVAGPTVNPSFGGASFSDPTGIVFHPNGNYAYVADGANGILGVIDVAQNQVIETIFVGSDPFDLDISPDGTTIYLGSVNQTIRVFDASTSPEKPVLVDTIPLSADPNFIKFSPDGTLAYTTHFATDNVSVIDVATRQVLTTIDVGFGPWEIAFCEDNTVSYITNLDSDTVSVIDVQSSEVTDTIFFGSALGVDITTLPTFEGIRCTNRFAMQMEFFDQLTWTQINNPAITTYRILEGQIVLGEVSASGQLVFLARNRPRTLPVTYTLQALDENGNVIATLTTTVP